MEVIDFGAVADDGKDISKATAKLSVARAWIGSASTESAAYFVGGIHNDFTKSTEIDVFSLAETGQLELEGSVISYDQPRIFHAVVASKDKVFIAGGR